MNEFLLKKMVDLVKKGKLTVEQIKDTQYKEEVESRISQQVN